MAWEPKEGYGALFKNDDKESENHPDYKGNIMLDGKMYEIAGWKKEGKSGTFLSLKGQIPRSRREDAPAAPRGGIPF